MKELIKSITAQDIIKLLAQKHAEDVWVPECKNGPSQTQTHLRLDGWAMKKSWSSPLVMGYEVKVSRSDFLNDKKWMGYLPLCNELYFVCPAGVIKETEVPESAGLIHASKNGRTLITKKKAPYREVTIPESLFRYIIMCRAKIGGQEISESLDRATIWRQWLEEKAEHRHLGYKVAQGIRETVELTRRENVNLKQKIEEYESVITFLKSIGFTEPAKEWISPHSVKNKLEQLTQIIPPSLEFAIKNLASQLEKCQNSINASKELAARRDAA